MVFEDASESPGAEVSGEQEPAPVVQGQGEEQSLRPPVEQLELRLGFDTSEVADGPNAPRAAPLAVGAADLLLDVVFSHLPFLASAVRVPPSDPDPARE